MERSIATPDGDFPVNYTFKADGDKLTGSMVNMDGMPIPVTAGKVDGANITFTVTLDLGGMPLVFNYKGVVSAEEIKLSTDFMGMPFEYTREEGQIAAYLLHAKGFLLQTVRCRSTPFSGPWLPFDSFIWLPFGA